MSRLRGILSPHTQSEKRGILETRSHYANTTPFLLCQTPPHYEPKCGERMKTPHLNTILPQHVPAMTEVSRSETKTTPDCEKNALQKSLGGRDQGGGA